MMKKIWIPMITAALIAVLAGGWLVFTVSAHSNEIAASSNSMAQSVFGQRGGILARMLRARSVIGKVTAVNANELTVQTASGDIRNFTLDSRTRYRSRGSAGTPGSGGAAQNVTNADIKVGNWVAVVEGPAHILSQQPAVARLVIILPDDFNPQNVSGGRGQVVSVDTAAGSFTLKAADGTQQTVKVDNNTQFTGQASNLSDLQPGMSVLAVSEKNANGNLVAKTVRAGYPQQRRTGSIVSVDANAGQFTLKTARSGETLTISVSTGTTFRSQNNSIKSLSDLKPGMMAMVVVSDESGALTARVVAAGNRQNLPTFARRVGGMVTGVQGSSFSIQARDGQTYTFQVDANTIFRSRNANASIKGLGDLKVGDRVAVGANDSGNGQFTAVFVMVMAVK